MSDTPRTDARLGYGNEHHGANMLCRELERELNAAIKELDDARRAFDDIDMCKLGQAPCAWAMQLIEERDALKTDRDAFKREFLKAVEACSFMQSEPEFSCLLGDSTTSDGVLLLKKQRDENKAGWDRASLVALRLERERNEARGCLCRLISALETLPRNSLGIGGDGETHWYIVDELICSASKAAGLEKT